MRQPIILLGLAALACAADPVDTRILMLSGHGNDDGVPWEFQCTGGRNSGIWSTIPVPSNWECQGFGNWGYGNAGSGKIDKNNERGLYRRSFSVPSDWQDRHIRLVFEGVQTDATIRVNGQSAGDTHQGGFYRFTYDVTTLVKPGADNLIEVDVSKKSADKSVTRAECQGDYWNFGGIYRPVYLECDPPRHIVRVGIDAKADGHFTMDVFPGGTGDADRVEAVIQGLDGRAVVAPISAAVASQGSTRLSAKVPKPRTWSAETPNLYQVEVRLKKADQVLHRKVQRFGFRTIELRQGDGLYVNGRRVILQGANRHSFWPDSGRCTSVKISRMDIELMKKMNCNAVRMSHYPPDQHFLDLCDELGLYVINELAGWKKSYATPVGRKLVTEMVARDVNHPSILIWSNGNEGGSNKELDDDFARWDPQNRPVIHPWKEVRGFNTKHYPTFSALQKLATGPHVYMPTEFLHARYDGGAGANMENYWPLLRGPRCAGGFVWAWVDECVKRTDCGGKLDSMGWRAPDGIVGPYRQREGSFYTLKKLWSPVQIPLKSLPEPFTGTLPVENRYHFTDLKQCRFAWQLRRLHGPADPKAGHTVVAQGDIAAPAVSPGATGTLNLSLPAKSSGAEVLAVTAHDPAGHELWTWTWPIAAAPKAPAVAPNATLTEQPDAYVLATGDLVVTLSRSAGLLTAAQRGASRYPLVNGPRPTQGSAELTGISGRVITGVPTVEATYSGGMTSIRWRLGGDGWLHCDYAYRHDGEIPHLGVGFDLPEKDMVGMRWRGRGPYRVWKNRMVGGTLDVWDLEMNNTQTGSTEWIYPESKGYFADVRWVTLRTTAGPLTVRTDRPFVQVLRPELPDHASEANPIYTYNFASCDFALLDVISPIGDARFGPQSQLTQASGEYRGTASFWFGPNPR
jgi:hypothetical protein